MNATEKKELILSAADNVRVLKPWQDPIKGQTRYAVLPHTDPVIQSCIYFDPEPGLEAEIIARLGDYEARHTYGHPLLFKPSLYEVLRYAPEYMLGKFNAVTVEYAGFDGDLHLSRVTMYNVKIV